MNIIAAVLAVFLIVVLVGSSIADFKKSPQVVELITKLKIPEKSLPLLGSIKTAGAIGLVLGFFSLTFALLVGSCLSIYFAIATVTHTRIKAPLREAVPALSLMTLSVLYVLVTIAK